MAGLRTLTANTSAARTIAGDTSLVPAVPNRLPEARPLVDLALSDDPYVSEMACRELRRRLDHRPEPATQPEPTNETPSPFSDQAVAIYARMDDGSTFLALIDPDLPQEAS